MCGCCGCINLRADMCGCRGNVNHRDMRTCVHANIGARMRVRLRVCTSVCGLDLSLASIAWYVDIVMTYTVMAYDYSLYDYCLYSYGLDLSLASMALSSSESRSRVSDDDKYLPCRYIVMAYML